MLASGVAANPKTWNRYAYCLNNPLKFIDPTGLIWTKHNESGERKWFDDEKDITKDYTKLTAAEHRYQATDDRWVQLDPNARKWGYTDHVEVIIWDSTLTSDTANLVNFVTGLGGHVSYNINGQSWSWEMGGWADPEAIESYIEHNNEYRSGTGYVLDGGPEWNRRLAGGIMGGYEGVDNGAVLPGFGGYNLVQNNCGEGFCRAVNNIGGLPRNTGIRPAAHGEYIENNMKPFIRQMNLYPKIQVTRPNTDSGHTIGTP